jgi:hypothetical protein
MKKIISQTTVLLLILTGVMIACGKKEKEEKPIEIPITEYSLAETSCRWTNLDCNGKVIVINSPTELAKYVTCTDGSYPEIEFTKNTLLLACGCTTNGIQYMHKKFLKKGYFIYMLEIEVTLNDATIVQPWRVALVTDKLTVKDVKLNVITIRN